MTYEGNLAMKVQLDSLDRQTELELRSKFSNQLGLMSKQLRKAFKKVCKTTKQIPIMCKELENSLMVFILAYNSKLDKVLSIVVNGEDAFLTSDLVFTDENGLKFIVLDGLTVQLLDSVVINRGRSEQVLKTRDLIMN